MSSGTGRIAAAGLGAAARPARRTGLGALAGRREIWPFLALALILAVDSIITPGFFDVRIVDGRLYGSVVDVFYRGTPMALVALGMAVVIGTKGIDLSVGAVVAIVGAVMTDLIHRELSPVSVLLLTLGAGLVCGLWNGILVAFLGIQPIIATLILMVAGRGIAQMINEGKIITFRSDFFSAISTGQFLTVPSRILVAAGVLALLWLLLRRTALGLFVESVGGNPDAARLAGVQVRIVTMGAYVVSALCATVAGILICADVRGSDANNAGLWIELDAILAVVLGGGSLMGGRIYLGLTVVGVLIIQSLTTSILVSGLPPQYNLIVKAAVVLAVLLLQSSGIRASLLRVFRGRRP